MTGGSFSFDEEIDRREVPALKPHRIVLGDDGMDLFPAGVADMDFRVAPPIHDALEKRLRHGVFGYETVPSGLIPALRGWFEKRHHWQIEPDHILRAPNVLCSLAIAASLTGSLCNHRPFLISTTSLRKTTVSLSPIRSF